MTRIAVAALLPGTVALFVACNSASDAVQNDRPKSVKTTQLGPVKRAIDWYPLETGAVWEYRVTKESVIRLGDDERKTSKPGTMIDRCLGPSPQEPSVQLLQRRIEERNPNAAAPVALTTVQRLSVATNSISALSIQQQGHQLVSYAVPHPVFSFDITNQRTTQSLDALKLEVAPVSLSSEPVRVPVGDYPDAIKRVVRGSVGGRLGSSPVERGTVVETTWFVRGVGPVKVERTLDVELRVGSATATATERSARVLVKFSNPGSDEAR